MLDSPPPGPPDEPGLRTDTPDERALRLTPGALARAFAEMSLHGFGGVMPWARRVLVERYGWIDDSEFAEMLSVSQLVPGDNVSNLAVIFGYRYGGTRGALAALGGLLAASLGAVLLLGVLYHHFGGLPPVRGALRGVSAAVAGLILMTGVRLAQSQPRTGRGLVFGLLAFGGVGLAHWPMAWVMLTLIPLALLAEWRASR